MILPDLNLLLYAYNPHVQQHTAAFSWWEAALNGDELIGLPHEILFGFIRIATNKKLGAASVTMEKAKETVDVWVNLPQSKILLPDPAHYERVLKLMMDAQATGPILSDAILASYAICNRATLYSNDTDFARFRELKWTNPLVRSN
jgi:toxin-antitoxin system PIN domain toxin